MTRGELDALGAVVLQAAALVTALGVLFGLFWWLVKPRVLAWVQDQLVNPVQETNRTVTVNGGISDPPTLRDDLSNLARMARLNQVGVKRANEQITTIREVVESARDTIRSTRQELHDHGEQGRAAMAIYRKALADQGIHLPVAPGEDGYGVPDDHDDTFPEGTDL